MTHLVLGTGISHTICGSVMFTESEPPTNITLHIRTKFRSSAFDWKNITATDAKMFMLSC